MRAFLLSIVVALLVLAGCGQKGPLYRPADDPAEEESASE